MCKYLHFFLLNLLLFSSASFSVAANQIDPAIIPLAWTPQLAVEFALDNSPDSQIAKERIEAASAASQLAQASYLPTVGLHAGYSQTNNPMYSFGNILNQGAFDNTIDFNNPGRTDNINLTADINYRLYNGGRDRAAIKAAKSSKQSIENEYITVRQNLAFEVIKTFHSILQSGDMLSAQESSLKAINTSLKVAQARYEEGTLLKDELLNLEVQKASAGENIIQSRHHKKILERIFLNLLGIKTAPSSLIFENTDQQIPAGSDFELRPELHSLDKAIAAAEAELVRAQGGKLPTVDGFASYQYDQGNVLGESGDSWLAGVKVNYTLYDGHQTKANIAMAKSALLQLKKQRLKTELSLNLELEQAELDIREAEERQIVTQKMVESAQESARLSRIRFKEGVILSLDLINVETRLSDALARQSIAKAMYRTAIANMRRAAGLPQFL